MEDKNKDLIPEEGAFVLDEPPLFEEPFTDMPELTLDPQPDELLQVVEDAPPLWEEASVPEADEESVFIPAEEFPREVQEMPVPDAIVPAAIDEEFFDLLSESDAADEMSEVPEYLPDYSEDDPVDYALSSQELESYLNVDEQLPDTQEWDAPQDVSDPFFTDPALQPKQEQTPSEHVRTPKKGRPKRKQGYGLLGIPHMLATVVWLAIIVMIGTSLGRMLWVCAADVLAFGRESKKVSVTITSNDTIEEVAEKLHEAELIRYPGLFKLYASIAVDEGDIIPGTFEMDTLYDYHALVVQMGPRSSTRSVVEDLLIPEGLNCRQVFELLEEKNICTVRELEEYAANGEFSEFWFLEGVERGDKYCLEGFLFPDTYDFYEHSTPREALGKMLLGFEARVNQEETLAALAAMNQRLSNMMRAKGCSEEHIAQNQLDLRQLLTVASLIEEETASAKESPMIASVIFNRLTEDQMYERYLNIDAAIIYATGSASNIDTSIDHPYNTYKYAGLTPGPISNPGLESISAALNFADTNYYYYVLNPETEMHQFSKTLEEHEKWVEEFRQDDEGEE